MAGINEKKDSWALPLADMVATCLSPLLARYGFGEADIITHWDDIVGPRIAASTRPLKLKGMKLGPRDEAQGRQQPTTLMLRVDGGFALEMQHLAPTVINRINDYLGWRCVGRLVLTQGPVRPPDPPKAPKPPPAPHVVAKALQATEGITEENLRDSLIDLGVQVLRD